MITDYFIADDDDWPENKHYATEPGEDILFKWRTKYTAIDVLRGHRHSLVPDMVFGWKPKIVSCPLPLTYCNPYVDALIKHLRNDDRYSIVYLGPRISDSVQVNLQYEYTWKYRHRYTYEKCSYKCQTTKSLSTYPKIKVSPITFDSKFENGNLDLAIYVKLNEYDLFLRSDTNTRGHTSWYYFKVNNSSSLGIVQFNICNFGKANNLYNQGMRPYVLAKGVYWEQKDTFDVCFVERLCRYGFDIKTSHLQFKYNFTSKNQSVCFAYSIPYTYSKLYTFIKYIVDIYPQKIKTTKLCYSLGGIDIPLLIISNHCYGSYNQQTPKYIHTFPKQVILVTARIHPGYSNSSHMMYGFIRDLLFKGDTLLEQFVFYIIPMLNPDGVIVGNFRTSYSGKDLNRQFYSLDKFMFPYITKLNDLVKNLKKSYHGLVPFYFDFHGHSSKKGLFCYGPEYPPARIYYFKARAFAKIIEQIDPIFDYNKSIFTISYHKTTTGRAHMLWKMRIPFTFTFEISNGIYDLSDKKGNCIDRDILLRAGSSILAGLMRYCRLEMKIPQVAQAKIDTGINKRKRRVNKINKDTEMFLRTKTSKMSRSKPKKNGKILYSTFNSNFSVNKRQLYSSSKHVLKTSENEAPQQYQSNTFADCDNDYFGKLIKYIKYERTNGQYPYIIEGGSDSYVSNEDLPNEEILSLFHLIQYQQKQAASQTRSSYRKPKPIILEPNPRACILVYPSTSKKIRSFKYLSQNKIFSASAARRYKRPQTTDWERVVVPQKTFLIGI